MWFLRQSTASQEIPLGPFVDSTDGNTAKTGLTIANTDIKLQKTGATSQTNKNSGGATHIATGDYYTVLDATDTDTIGPMRVKVHVAGALPVWLDCCVLDEAVYDVLFGTTAPSTLAGTAQTGDAYAIVNHGTYGNAAIKTLEDAIAGYLDTEIAAIKTKTDNLPAAPAATGDIPTADENADALLDLADGVETGLTVRGALRLALAALAGKLSGAGTSTEVFRNAVGDSKDRITATVDGSGNRIAITTDAT